MNLAQALRRLRHCDDDRILWVDALCISQTDLGEKSQQVQMIGDIVQGATRTLAWVGEHRNGSEDIFRYAEKPRLEQLRWRLACTTKDMLKILHTWARFLYNREYWHRLWIVQEVVTAKDLVICCGSDSQRWDDLLLPLDDLRDSIESPPPDLLSPLPVFGGAPKTVGLADLLSVETFESFNLGHERLSRLKAHRQRYLRGMPTRDVDSGYSGLDPDQYATSPTVGTRCLDRRDIVYAVLSLETDASVRGKIAVDYECSIWDLAFRVLKATSDRDHRGSGLWGDSRVYAILRLQDHEKRHLVDLIFVDLGEWTEMLIDAVIEVLISYDDENQVNLYDLPFKYVKPLPDQHRKSLLA